MTDFLYAKQTELIQDANISFLFTYQSKKKTDIGVKFGQVYSANNREPFCWIEAKRLPTPKRNNDRDEREYVIVDKTKYKGNGGIQRFKECKHAPRLPFSIMIGYIQDNNNADYWLCKINSWIKELADIDKNFWSIEEYLNKYSPSKCDRFLSIHKRTDKTIITLHHFWIKL